MTDSLPNDHDNHSCADAHARPDDLYDESPLASADPVARFSIPRLSGLSGIQVVRRALDQAKDHKSGVVVVAPLGFGKSEGAHAARARHADEQRELTKQNARHRRTRVRYINLQTARTERQLLISILQDAVPGQVVRERLPGGRRKDERDLRKEVYRVYRAQGVVTLIIDDAQRLTDAGLQVARDLIAEKEEDPHRSVAGRQGGAETPAVGIGVLLIGTPELEARLVKTGETHGAGRWSFVNQVDPLTDIQLPNIYQAIFPAFRDHISSIGRGAWNEFVLQHVALGRSLPIRTVTTHAREYFAVTYDRTRGAVSERERTPFDRVLFLETLRAVLWETSSARQSPRTEETLRESPGTFGGPLLHGRA